MEQSQSSFKLLLETVQFKTWTKLVTVHSLHLFTITISGVNEYKKKKKF
jgi:hypothetical protein